MQYIVHPEDDFIHSIGDEANNEFFFHDTVSWRQYIVATEDGKMCGMISYMKRENKIDGKPVTYYGISAVSTHKEYKNRGIATKLLHMFFEIASREGVAIKPGFYEPEGRMYIKEKIEQFSQDYNVPLILWYNRPMMKNVYRKDTNEFCFSSDTSVDDATLIQEALELLGKFGDSENSFYVEVK